MDGKLFTEQKKKKLRMVAGNVMDIQNIPLGVQAQIT